MSKMILLADLILLVAWLYLFLCAWMFVFQRRMIFRPRRGVDRTPTAQGLEYEEVGLSLPEEGRAQAWWVSGKHPTAPVILFCHGNAGNLADRISSLQLFHGLGAATLIFDYPGYGDSPGQPSEDGCYAAAEAAWQWLTETKLVPPARIIILGRSLGGAVAAWLAQNRPAGALIVESAFTSAPELGAELYPYLPVKALCRYRFDTREYLGKVRCPVTIIHSRDDETVPFEHGEALFAAAAEPKFMVVIGGDHNERFLDSGETYTAAVAAVLDEVAVEPS